MRAISRALNLPYATVWRQVQAAVANGTLTARDDGYVATRAHLAGATPGPNIDAANPYILRKLGELNALGFDPSEAGQCYIGERPPLLALT